MVRMIDNDILSAFERYLRAEEKQPNTIQKYLRDVRTFCTFADKKQITKELVINYKRYLLEHYRVSSANSMLVALNQFFKWIGWTDCIVKTFKVQTETFRSDEQELSLEEYQRLATTAQQRKQTWLYLVIVTLCATGIRVSELSCITVQALFTRQAIVRNKGKSRKVILPVSLCRKLIQYAQEKEITEGSIFVTRNGKPIDRSNIYHAMKRLCKQAKVEQSKVFPHNLRHLFAVQHYEKHHDLSGLASILGHCRINTTRIYTLVTIGKLEADINALGLVV